VAAVGISPCGKYVAAIDKHDKHRVTIYNVARKVELVTVDGSKAEVLDLQWSKRPDDLRFCVVGPKEINFWHPSDVTKKLFQKGTFGKAQMTNLLCAVFDEEGWCYTGAENGLIQVWNAECQVVKTVKAHALQVVAVATSGSKLISGSKE
jgi:WD40 repeat protein